MTSVGVFMDVDVSLLFDGSQIVFGHRMRCVLYDCFL